MFQMRYRLAVEHDDSQEVVCCVEIAGHTAICRRLRRLLLSIRKRGCCRYVPAAMPLAPVVPRLQGIVCDLLELGMLLDKNVTEITILA